MENMTVTVKCVKCNKDTLVSGLDLKQRNGIFSDGKELLVTYYTCPHCHIDHHVSVDDNETLRLMRVLKDSIKRADNQNKTKGRVKNSTIKVIENNKKKHEKARNALNIGYDGSVYQFGGKEYKLELCVPAQ